MNNAKKEKVKLALVHPRYRPDGGAERAILNILTALENEIQISILSRNRWESNSGEPIEFIQCNPFYIGRLWRKWSFIQSAYRALENIQVDIIQSQVRLPGCDIYRAGGGVYLEWLNQRRRISNRLMNWFRSMSPYHNYKLYMERKMYNHPALKAVICNSMMVKKELLANYSIEENKIHVIYNAVDLEHFKPANTLDFRSEKRELLGIGEDETMFLYVGSGFERKGLNQLLFSFASLPETCHLVVVGKEQKQRAYEQRAKKLGIGNQVHFMGIKKEIRPYYAAADVFVLPTFYDPFANTVLEAMACGLPVVTGDKCGAVDIIENGENGFICDPLDTATLTEYLDALQQSPELRKSMGTSARATVEEMNFERMKNSLLSLYESILSHKPEIPADR